MAQPPPRPARHSLGGTLQKRPDRCRWLSPFHHRRLHRPQPRPRRPRLRPKRLHLLRLLQGPRRQFNPAVRPHKHPPRPLLVLRSRSIPPQPLHLRSLPRPLPQTLPLQTSHPGRNPTRRLTLSPRNPPPPHPPPLQRRRHRLKTLRQPHLPPQSPPLRQKTHLRRQTHPRRTPPKPPLPQRPQGQCRGIACVPRTANRVISLPGWTKPRRSFGKPSIPARDGHGHGHLR